MDSRLNCDAKNAPFFETPQLEKIGCLAFTFWPIYWLSSSLFPSQQELIDKKRAEN